MIKKNKKSSIKGTSLADADKIYIREALREAVKARDKGEVPVGAVAVVEKRVIARAHNLREKNADPLGHAEVLLIKKLSKKLKTWRLDDVTIYVTCEPCLMCAGAMLQARVKRVVFGCYDKKAGAMGTLYDVSSDDRLNHKIEVSGGVLREECASALSSFFDGLRAARLRSKG
jgi:tRNA(adenine34) deaminase